MKRFKIHIKFFKSKKKYSWSDETELSKGIIETIKWIKKNINYFKKTTLNYIHKK